MKPTITPVLLCGGSGTRLWPLSRQSFPKQFVPLLGNKSLLQLTVERMAALEPRPSKVLCVAAEEHRFMVADTLRAAGAKGTVILEPCPRNTAAAMALAALVASPEDLLLFCPSDHHIPDAQAFAGAVHAGRTAAEQGAIVLFGIHPSFPSTAYGYIRQGDARPDNTRGVASFVEKPPIERAQALLLGGDALWNAGIFLCQARTLLSALTEHAPDILAACQTAMIDAQTDGDFLRPDSEAFGATRSQSIDHAVMEHHANLALVPLAAAWSDVGSWNAVAELTPADEAGNRVHGDGLAFEASHTYIHAPCRPVVALGTQNLFIVDTPDALLVVSTDHVEQVKQVVAALDARQTPEAVTHHKVNRPWGWYDSVDAGDRFRVKRISVKPGASLSLQKHHHRAEHWVVVRGTAEVTRDNDTFLLTENQSTYIPLGVVHRLSNPGKTDLEMIEVQSGSYLGEDDIVRIEDVYGRG